ncbi:uncharacterized protein LOC144798714 isoform X2 [Lissotriton helveticus]
MAADKWLSPNESTKEEIMDRIYLEQFVEALPFSTQRWLKQHPDLTTAQAVEMANTYSRVQQRPLPAPEPDKAKAPFRPEKKILRAPEVPKPRPWKSEPLPHTGPQCFECGTWGHIARHCPRRRPADEPMEVGYLPRPVLYSAEMGHAYRPTQYSEWTRPNTYSCDEEDDWPFNPSGGREEEESRRWIKTENAQHQVCLYTGGAVRAERCGEAGSSEEEQREDGRESREVKRRRGRSGEGGIQQSGGVKGCGETRWTEGEQPDWERSWEQINEDSVDRARTAGEDAERAEEDRGTPGGHQHAPPSRTPGGVRLTEHGASRTP